MSVPARALFTALNHALTEYDHQKMGQRWLKPVAVLTIDALVPSLGIHAGPRPFLCMNAMQKGGWRSEVRAGLQHLNPYDHECLVDLSVMQGENDPYTVWLTAESEGYPQHWGALHDDARWGASDYMWDLYKLLMVPSPTRLFFTLCAAEHHDLLQRRSAQLIQVYAPVSGQSEIWALQFPTASMRKHPVRVLHWAAGSHAAAPRRQDWILGQGGLEQAGGDDGA